MNKTGEFYKRLINILEKSGAEFKLFTHQPARTYEELARAQQEAGFVGTEGKCMVLRADERFIVYITIQGEKVDIDRIKKALNLKNLHLANHDELRDQFGAEPGCAYPFGFGAEVDIYVDPQVYNLEWFLFSPVLPTKTVQLRGSDLKKIFSFVENNVIEKNFNQTNER